MTPPAYLQQYHRHRSTCALFALANACVYLGLPHPDPDSDEWWRVNELGGRPWYADPWLYRLPSIAARVGVRLVPCAVEDLDEHTPAMVRTLPDSYPPSHWSCVIEATRERLTVANWDACRPPALRTVLRDNAMFYPVAFGVRAIACEALAS